MRLWEGKTPAGGKTIIVNVCTMEQAKHAKIMAAFGAVKLVGLKRRLMFSASDHFDLLHGNRNQVHNMSKI